MLAQAVSDLVAAAGLLGAVAEGAFSGGIVASWISLAVCLVRLILHMESVSAEFGDPSPLSSLLFWHGVWCRRDFVGGN